MRRRANDKDIWTVHCVLSESEGNVPTVIAFAAVHLTTNRVHRQIGAARPECFDSPETVLCVFGAPSAAALVASGMLENLGLVDVHAEFRNTTNGQCEPRNATLTKACAVHGADVLAPILGSRERSLVARGGPYTSHEQDILMSSATTTAEALAKIVLKLLATADFEHLLLRGRFLAAYSRIHNNGVPTDRELYEWFRQGGLAAAAAKVQTGFGVLGRDGGLSRSLFGSLLEDRGIDWPRSPDGGLRFDSRTFAQMTRAHPELEPLHDVLLLRQIRTGPLAVGADGRCRAHQHFYGTKTGRAAPRRDSIVGGSKSVRGLVRPGVGQALAVVDWQQEEFGIAAALSQDQAMMADYRRGDPYVALAQRAAAIPGNATAMSHPEEREQYKTCALGMLYGMGAKTLAIKTDSSVDAASELLANCGRLYHIYCDWSDRAVDHARLYGYIHTTFGWRMFVDRTVNDRTIRNFPVQGNGAELMRLATIFATEAGVRICATVHDAFVIEAGRDEVESSLSLMVDAMNDACDLVLQGFRLKVDIDIIHHPDRWADEQLTRLLEMARRTEDAQ